MKNPIKKMIDEDEIVISGISGRFPESSNMNEFRDNLLNGLNMVTVNERRFKPGVYGIPEGFGALKEIDKFDAEFFRVFPAQAARMDPQLRMTLETTYEAMQDAGVNPQTERESRTGVFLGVCGSEANILWNGQASKVEGPTMTGCAHSMFANRVSFAFDFNGPSCSFDTACSTSIVALEAAISSIRAGKCDAAIVTASTLILTPHTTLQFQKLGMLAPDSACKSFDSSGNGYVRSEAVATIYLQKKSIAKRAYATVVHAKTNTDGYKDPGITYPSAALQAELLRETYEEADVDKNRVMYVECHGTGTAVGDPQELLSIEHTFITPGRTAPLYVGSVKSNMGHSEGASGLCGIAKLLIALQEGVIPGNLHFKTPHYSMKGVRDGKIKIVDKNTKFPEGGLVALNSFGFGGVNTHLILKPFTKQPEYIGNGQTQNDTMGIPKLITMSGRTEEGLRSTLKEVGQLDNIYLNSLIISSHKSDIPNHIVRGFSIPELNVTRVDIAHDSSPIWFVFNGIGSQWTGMGKSLMQLPVFATSIQKSAQTLRSKFNFDLIATLDSEFVDPISCFTSIAAIQIGLVDLLASVGVTPRGFLGHSAGEMLCAYVDGCLNAEETITCAYLRGLSLGEAATEDKYSMAAVALNWPTVAKTCPDGVFPACHNGKDSVTISGPKELVATYVTKVKKELKSAAKVVNSCGVAFHSPYIEGASKTFMVGLKSLIPEPKSRSKKWISTSVNKVNWGDKLAATASPAYFNNNFRAPVLFYDACKEIPANSKVIEIGPSGLLKGLIKRTVPSCTIIPLQNKDSKDGLADFLTALGDMYVAGIEVDVNQIYGVKYPVPLGTPMLSPYIHWDHESSWDVPKYGENGEFLEVAFDIDIGKDGKYLTGHQLQGRALFPATGYLVLVWKAFAQMHQMDYENFPVIFENVRFTRVTVLREGGKFEFRVNISDLTGNFEVKEGGAAVVFGVVKRPVEETPSQMDDQTFAAIQNSQPLSDANSKDMSFFTTADIYKQLRFSGYEYSGIFKGIRKRDRNGKYFNLAWNNNWVAFLDTCLQTALTIFSGKSQTELPTGIEKLAITPREFLNFVANNKTSIKQEGIFVYHDQATNLTRCKGIELCGFTTTAVGGSRREPAPVLSPYNFCSYFDEPKDSAICPITQFVTIIMENIRSSLTTLAPEIIEFTQRPGETDSLKISKLVREDYAMPDVTYSLYSEDCRQELIDMFARGNISLLPVETITRDIDIMEQRYDVLILDNHLFFRIALDYVRRGGFLICKLGVGALTRERVLEKLGQKFSLIAHRETATHEYFLARKDMKHDFSDIRVIPVSTSDLTWVTTVRDLMIHQEVLTAENPEQILPLIYLVSNDDELSGITGLTLCIRKEPEGQNVRSIYARRKIPLDFENPDDQLKEILKRDLAITVIDFDGRSGCYVHTPIQDYLKPTEHVFLGQETVGDLASLRWVESFSWTKAKDIPAGFVPVNVRVAALNFKDIMLSSGNLQPDKRAVPLESPLGIEFSGVTQDGVGVFGFTDGQSLATDVLANADWLWKIPKGWDFAQAATVPVVYSTVYLALVIRGQIQEGESILIHAGAGGVGLAAITVALSKNCKVFTTVGSKEKIAFIREKFPQIPLSQIASSRTTDFETMVRTLTQGRGVDLILNSLSGDKLEASVRCLARHGRFLEIGKVDLVSNKSLGMRFFLQDASYHGVMLDSLWDARPSVRKQLREVIQQGLDSGVIQPLPYRSFNHEQVEPAFRYLAQGRHIGKVVVTFEPNQQIQAFPHVYFYPSKSYIIIGGLGGVGLEFGDWMVTRNARKLVLTTRSGVTTAYQSEYIRNWENRGVTVKIMKIDASDETNARILLEETQKLGPLGGFFNLAMLLHIGLMKVQTEEGFKFVMGPKVDLTLHLDKLTRAMCPELDHFVLFSSIASGLGFDGQANYGQANSAAEKIIEQRSKDGFPAKAIQWGPIGETGAWHEGYNADFNRNSFHGSGVQSIFSAINSLDILLQHAAPVMLSRRLVEAGAGAAGGRGALQLGVVDRIAHILGLNHKRINPNSKLTELGMDSVMSMEVRQVLETDFNLTLTAVEIRGSTLKQLEEMAHNNPKNRLNVSRAKMPAATAPLFQLNFVKTMGRSRFVFNECVYAVNDGAAARMAMADKAKAQGQGQSLQPHPGGVVFIINSIEGPDVLRLLGSLVNLPTYCMQMATDATFGDIECLEKYYFEKMKAVEPVGPYTVIGYSAGVFVAIELGLRLQKMGEITKLILLDMSPARFRAILDENFGEDRTNLDEVDIMVVMMSQIFGLDRDSIETILRREPTTEARIQKIIELMSQVFDEKIDVDTIMSGVSNKGKVFLETFDNYRPTGILTGNTILVKTTQNLISYDSTEYWGLEEFCTPPPTVRIMDTTHSYLLTEPTVRQVATCINND